MDYIYLNSVLCNTLSCENEIAKVMLIHPRSKHGHVIDLTITRRDVGKFCNACFLSSVECNTNDKVVVGY